MRRVVIECSRCNHSKTIEKLGVDVPGYVALKVDEVFGKPPECYDLCSDCLAAFKTFLREGKTVGAAP